MKEVKSYSLEKDIIDFIRKYREEHSLSSDSAALERIVLLVMDPGQLTESLKKDIIKDVILELTRNQEVMIKIKDIKDDAEVEENIGLDETDEAIINMYNSMPD